MRPKYVEALRNLRSLTNLFEVMGASFEEGPGLEVGDKEYSAAMLELESFLDKTAKQIQAFAQGRSDIRRDLIQKAQNIPGFPQRLTNSLVQRRAVLIDLGPEGIKETEHVSEIMHGLAARTRGLRKMLEQRGEPVFRRLMKETGYLKAAQKALKEALGANKTLSKVWNEYESVEGAFLNKLFEQAPEQYRLYIQVQHAERA